MAVWFERHRRRSATPDTLVEIQIPPRDIRWFCLVVDGSTLLTCRDRKIPTWVRILHPPPYFPVAQLARAFDC